MNTRVQAWVDYAEANDFHFHAIERDIFLAGYDARVDEHLRLVRIHDALQPADYYEAKPHKAAADLVRALRAMEDGAAS